MVESEEIMRVAKLMRIRIDDEKEHVKRVQKILEYFDTLDAANVESENLESNSMSVEDLRDDVHSKFKGSLIDQIKNYQGTYSKPSVYVFYGFSLRLKRRYFYNFGKNTQLFWYNLHASRSLW